MAEDTPPVNLSAAPATAPAGSSLPTFAANLPQPAASSPTGLNPVGLSKDKPDGLSPSQRSPVFARVKQGSPESTYIRNANATLTTGSTQAPASQVSGWQKTANFGKGLWEGSIGGLIDLGTNLVTHPIDTTKHIGSGLYQLGRHPIDSGTAITNAIQKDIDSDGGAHAAGYVVGNILFVAATMGAGAGADAAKGAEATAEAANAAKEASVAANAAKGAEVVTETANAAKEAGAAVDAATTVGEPVSVVTGEYLETWLDFLIPGAFALNGARYMGLKLPDAARWKGPLGPCQISGFDEYFSNPERGALDFHQSDGKRIRFDRPFNFLSSKNAAFPHLELTAPWLKKLDLKDGRIIKKFRQFPDKFYRLEAIEDLSGNWIKFARNDKGVLTQVEREDGVKLLFENDARGRRTAITLVGIDGAMLPLARYAYDKRGRMIHADCVYGMSVRYDWHETQPLLLRWRNKTERSETHFTYDDDGRVIHTKTTGIWNDDRFRYDSDARITTYIPGSDERQAQRFAYDANENVTEEIDALGSATRYAYNKAGFRISTTDANGNSERNRYDIRGNLERHIDGAGRETIRYWGDSGELYLTIDGEGGKRRGAYDRFANLIKEIDAEGHETHYARDERGRILCATYPDGAKEERAYDERGWLRKITDAKGGVTQFSYDAFGRLTATTNALGETTQLAYQAGAGGFSAPTQITRPDGSTARRGFDAEGALAEVVDGEGRKWRYRYGAFDVLQEIIDPRGGKLTLAYDNQGRLIRVTNANGAIYEYARDAAGRIVEEKDFDDRVLRYERDAGGRVTARHAPDGGVLRYAYDGSNLLTRIEAYEPNAKDKTPDAPNATTEFSYDRRGLLIGARNADANVTYEYDGNGRIVAENQDYRRIVSRYDSCGRRIERAIGFAAGWNEKGKIPHGFQGLTQADINAGRIVTPYSIEPPQAPKPDTIARYQLDPLGLLSAIALEGESEKTHQNLRFQRDALGREILRANEAGFALHQNYTPLGQIAQQKLTRGIGVYAQGYQRSFAYDKAFSPVKIIDDLWGATSYSYDANGQPVEARHGEKIEPDPTRGASQRGAFGDEKDFQSIGFGDEIFAQERFSYDRARNIAANDISLAGQSLDRPLTPWLTTSGGKTCAARGPSGERIILTYDGCGRVIERRIERKGFREKIWNYQWDAFDRLKSCVNPNGEHWLYKYDPFGRRVEKRRAPAMPQLRGDRQKPVRGFHYIWDGDTIAEEIPLNADASLDMLRRAVWHFQPGSFAPLARESFADDNDNPVHLTHSVVTDHLGTPRELVSANGELTWAAEYWTWGAVRKSWKKPLPAYKTHGNTAYARKLEDEQNLCPIRFPGQWEDEESGLYYNRHRYYDPLSGGYACPDPIGLGGGDRPQGYVACPNVWADPLGLSAWQHGLQFRGDTRPPSTIFNEGFTPKGSSSDLYLHAKNNNKPPSMYVSTSKSESIAVEFSKDTHVYEIHPRVGGRDVNEILQNRSPFPREKELAVPWGIDKTDIVGMRPVIPGGELGPFISRTLSDQPVSYPQALK